MNSITDRLLPDWKWATAEGSRSFDRISDRQMTLLDILLWQEEAEDLTLMLERSREKQTRQG